MLEFKNQEIRIMETQEKKNRTKLYVTRNNLQKTSQVIHY